MKSKLKYFLYFLSNPAQNTFVLLLLPLEFQISAYNKDQFMDVAELQTDTQTDGQTRSCYYNIDIMAAHDQFVVILSTEFTDFLVTLVARRLYGTSSLFEGTWEKFQSFD